ncbi:MAG: GIY-YIG nuclease family protein [Vicinamibacterales bacterium]
MAAARTMECARLSSDLVHYVYILRCADDTLYTGYTTDLKARVATHNTGRGAKYTRSRRPVRLVYKKGFRSIGKALSREHALKQLTRTEKEALISEIARKGVHI